MSQEKFVEVVQRAFEVWNRGDIDAYLAHLCLDVEFAPVGAALEGKVYRGHDEVRAWWLAQAEVWETILICAEEFKPVGTKLMVSGHWEAVGRSGVELSAPATWVFGFSDGKSPTGRHTRLEQAPSKPWGCETRDGPKRTSCRTQVGCSAR